MNNPKKHAIGCISFYGPNDVCDCDGYHTFEELYEHRIRLFIELCKSICKLNKSEIWCSVFHSDGSKFDEWFILGIGKEKGTQITYHLPARFWSEVCEFAKVLKKAPEFDGHTSYDVLERLSELYKED